MSITPSENNAFDTPVVAPIGMATENGTSSVVAPTDTTTEDKSAPAVAPTNTSVEGEPALVVAPVETVAVDRYSAEDYDITTLLVNDLTGEHVQIESVTEELPVSAGTDSASREGNGSAGQIGSSTTGAILVTHRRRRRITLPIYVSLTLLILILLGVLAPLALAATYGANAYATYTKLRIHASNGVQHLLNVKSLFTGAGAHSTDMLNNSKLLQAKQEFAAARSDFEQVQGLIDHTALIQTVTQYLPQYHPQVTSGRAASQIGIDIASIGQDVTTTAIALAPKLRGPLLNYSHTPLVTPADLATLHSAIDTVLPLVDDIDVQSSNLSINDLPVSAHERDQVRQLLQMLPLARSALVQGRDLLPAAGWLLGVDQQRTFLLQTMDRSELRPTGGFTGQYGELQVAGGRVAPFTLKDIALLEYADNSPTTNQLAPAAYRSWWPFANWGLRDSNLSADFPTSAQIAINEYQRETNRKVDGVILFTPFLVAHLLQVIGPITLPAYGETITAQNLEARLHYYQLDNRGIRKEEIVEHVPNSSDAPAIARKLFTSRLAHTLIDRVRKASPTELIAIGKQMLADLKTEDLQVYVQNQQIEDLLMQYGYAAQVDRSTTHDGLFVVQANVSASKASQYVKTTLQDTVSLDNAGGATHVMHLHLTYSQLDTVYGLDTYRDYVRVYVPPTARFRSGDGFDTGTPLCDGPMPVCPQNGIYPHSELICPAGEYFGGAAAPMLNDPYVGQWHPLDTIGPPTNFTSDVPGRAMFAGYVVVPKNCSMTVTLSWYVPPTGHTPFALLVQRQAGTFPELDLTVLPTPGNCTNLDTQGLHTNRVLTEDVSFSLQPSHASESCYPQPEV